MRGTPAQLAPGLYFVATPIGSARDITLRALDILTSADLIAAEDTRTARHLMEIHAVPLGGRQVVAYHDHNGPAARPKLLRALAEGKSVAYVSEAGTPLVADPGFVLAREAIAAGVAVTSAPGPSAVVAALTIAGLPTDRFMFVGFPPNTKAARKEFFREFTTIPATLVAYESPKRLHASLDDLCEVYGRNRQAAMCRELTKKFEEVLRGTLGEIADELRERTVKGEIVLVIDRNREAADAETARDALKAALTTMSVKDAANAVAQAMGLPKRAIYQMALDLEKGE